MEKKHTYFPEFYELCLVLPFLIFLCYITLSKIGRLVHEENSIGNTGKGTVFGAV